MPITISLTPSQSSYALDADVEVGIKGLIPSSTTLVYLKRDAVEVLKAEETAGGDGALSVPIALNGPGFVAGARWFVRVVDGDSLEPGNSSTFTLTSAASSRPQTLRLALGMGL